MSSAFNDESYMRGYDSQRFDTFSSFSNDNGDHHDLPSPIYTPPPYVSTGANDTFSPPVSVPETPSTPPIYFGSGAYSPAPNVFASFSPEANGKPFDQGFTGAPDGPILPPPAELPPDEGFTLFEWRRQNALELQDKERMEKEQVLQIREEANEYIIDLQRRTKINCETNKSNNREKEKLFLANQEKFHAEAVKNYWKAIAGLVPNEVPNIEKRKGKKEEKPAIFVIQGPKPGKPTDLARMRSIILKLKQSPPLHMKPAPPPAVPTMPTKDAKATASTLPKIAVAVNAEAVAAA